MRCAATRSTYSRLLSLVTLTPAPPGASSTTLRRPKKSASSAKVRSSTSVMSWSSIHLKFLKKAGSTASMSS